MTMNINCEEQEILRLIRSAKVELECFDSLSEGSGLAFRNYKKTRAEIDTLIERYIKKNID